MANFNDGQIQQIVDLQQFFGVPGGIGNIITHAAINKWSRHKPVRFPTLAKLTDEQLKSSNNGFGATINRYTYVASMLAAVKGGTEDTAWQYLRPRGGVTGSAAEPFRHLDFDGYSHSAVAPIGTAAASEWQKEGGANTPLWILFSSAPHDGQNLQLEDFDTNTLSLKNYYLVLCLYNATTQLYVTRCTTADDITTAIRVSQLGTYTPYFGSTHYADGEWSAFVFLSDRPIPTGSTFATAGDYIPLAYSERLPFTHSSIRIKKAPLGITVDPFTVDRNNTTSSSNRYLYVAYTIHNADATSYQFDNSRVYVDFKDSSDNVRNTMSVSTSSISAGGTVTHARARYQLPNGTYANSIVKATIRFGIDGEAFSLDTDVTTAPPR